MYMPEHAFLDLGLCSVLRSNVSPVSRNSLKGFSCRLKQQVNHSSKGCVQNPFLGCEHTGLQGLAQTAISPVPDCVCGGTQVHHEPFDSHILAEQGHSWFLQDSSVCLKWGRMEIFFFFWSLSGQKKNVFIVLYCKAWLSSSPPARTPLCLFCFVPRR